MTKHILIIGGIAVMVFAILDMLDVPIEFPTQNNAANLAIGAGLTASPFLYAKLIKGVK